MPPVTISEIFENWSLTGDEGAFVALHDSCSYRLYKLAYSIVGCRETAEEITNDVFVRIWQRREQLGEVRSPEYYLLKCVRNGALEYLRSKKLALESLEDNLHPFTVEWKSTPEQILISSEMVLHINRAIDQLSPKCKLIFLLVKESNLKYREVAELLEISIKTVEAQMGTALKRISASVAFTLVK